MSVLARQYGDKRVEFSLTVANNGTNSTAADLHGTIPVGFYTPGTLTSTAVTFQFSRDNSTFYTVKKSDGNALSYTIAANGYYELVLDSNRLRGARYFRFVMGSSEGAERTMILIATPELNNN